MMEESSRCQELTSFNRDWEGSSLNPKAVMVVVVLVHMLKLTATL